MWMLVLTFSAVLLASFYLWMTRNYGCFEAKGIFEPPKSFPFGTKSSNWEVMLGRKPFFCALDDLYNEYNKDHKYMGVFENASPVLVINDLDMARNVLIKDFDHFTDRRSFQFDTTSSSNHIAANMMTMLKGERWRKARFLMSPAFTSGKLKTMVPLMNKVGNELVGHLEGLAKQEDEFSPKEMITSYTLDCIATCGFGVEASSFTQPDGVFRKMVFQATGGDKGNRKQMTNALIMMFLPSIAKALKLEMFDSEAILFFVDVIKKSVTLRKKEQIRRGDMIDLMLDALEKNNAGSKEEEEEEQDIETLMIANTVIFFFAGLDTSSTTLTMTMAYLAINPHIQERAYSEIKASQETKDVENIDYEDLMSLPYLESVFLETLRFYFTGNTSRVCTRDYKLLGTDFVVPKGMLVQVPSSAIQRNPLFYPDPDHYNPDINFSAEAKSNRPSYAFLAFGQGQRSCIGSRFALVQAKMCLVKILLNYKIIPGPKMPQEFDVTSDSFSGMPKGGIWCRVERRE